MTGAGAVLVLRAALVPGWQGPALMAPTGISHLPSLCPSVFYCILYCSWKAVSEAQFTSYLEVFFLIFYPKASYYEPIIIGDKLFSQF